MTYEYTTQGYTVTNAGTRIVVDPLTRIEGHLRCEVNIDANNVITNAVSCGTIFRGIEIILKGRDPRDAWAFVERICGVCTGTHALASVRAVENALHLHIPDNANCIRNLMQLCLWVHDHLVHLYHLAGLDWIDVVNATKADPQKTAALAQRSSPWANASVGYFTEVQNKLVSIITSGQLGIFSNGYWGHPAYKLPPEANLLLVAHYIEALDFQKDIVKIHTVFGGKNPHPNWLVGGVPCSLNLDNVGGADVISNERLALVQKVISHCREFVAQVVIPDTLLLARFYKDWFGIGTGLSNKCLLSFGEFPLDVNEYTADSLLIPPGAIIDGDFNQVHSIDLVAPTEVQESVGRSWYTYPQGVSLLHPFEGVTQPHYQLGKDSKGSITNIEQLDENAPYSWIKTPLWRGHTMEVGPLARTLIAYASKQEHMVSIVDDFCGRAGVSVRALQSTLGRIAARSLEAQWAADTMQFFYDRLVQNVRNGLTSTANTSLWKPQTWPKQARGVGFSEAPRGALGHWLVINDTKIERYQCIVPTTWNAAPRGPNGELGAYEAALMGTHMAVPEQPLEILRTIHSFDPCLACATHIMGDDGQELLRVRCDRRL